MAEINTAQQIHSFLGLPVVLGFKQAHGNKNASSTKSGPGRFHRAEHVKASPIKSKGAPLDFVAHHASAEKKARRDLVKAHGRRGALKAIKFWRSESKFNASLDDGRDDALNSHHYEPIEGYAIA